jgi:hypothetical protein
MIRSIDGRDLIVARPACGSKPIPARVMMTELITHDRDMDTSTTVSFKSEPLRGVVVPVEMRECEAAPSTVASLTQLQPMTGSRRSHRNVK